MASTKRELVEDALGGIGLASYVFDITPEEMQDALRRLDKMMARWSVAGLRLGYNLASPSDPDQDSGLPDHAEDAVTDALSIRLAPKFGKEVTADMRAAATESLVALQAAVAARPQSNLHPSLPLGAGNKPWRRGRVFVGLPVDELLTGEDGPLEFNP